MEEIVYDDITNGYMVMSEQCSEKSDITIVFSGVKNPHPQIFRPVNFLYRKLLTPIGVGVNDFLVGVNDFLVGVNDFRVGYISHMRSDCHENLGVGVLGHAESKYVNGLICKSTAMSVYRQLPDFSEKLYIFFGEKSCSGPKEY